MNNNNMEEVAVYVGLVWQLTAGLDRYAIPTYYCDDAERFLEQNPMLVSWEYEVDAEAPTVTARDKGFVPGCTARPFGRTRRTTLAVRACSGCPRLATWYPRFTR
ncbi:hypothetical protein [Streptomyces sp. f51]|uniref:hypothetical protein n=1 Tax=Streptomyces sp. f51 TaxID=1827742 RepID=UPI00117C7698|nr:hypothetical protein [Streptomyces sp. f51]